MNLRDACVEAAREVIAQEGIEHLSLRDVARRLGVSHQAPYRHFPTREHLLAEVMRRCYAQFAEHLNAAASNGQGAFFGLLEQAVAALSEAPQLSVQQLDYSGDGGELALQLRADDFASLEQLRQRLLQAGLQVQLGSASREEQGVSARMVIGGGA